MFADNSEWEVVFKPNNASRVGLTIPPRHGDKRLPILVDRARGVLVVGEIEAPLTLKPDEEVILRVFVDKNVVEVFANERQAAVVSFDPSDGQSNVALLCDGGDASVRSVKSWLINSIY
jgi:beta-fructofuranosidase